jgi:hypothetical protein
MGSCAVVRARFIAASGEMPRGWQAVPSKELVRVAAPDKGIKAIRPRDFTHACVIFATMGKHAQRTPKRAIPFC